MPATLIDVHSHALLPAFRQALADQGLAGAMPLPPWSVEGHLEAMDANGIDVCVLSLPEAMRGLADDRATALARTLNEELAEIVDGHPSRFGAFASLPVHDMDAALDELVYALDVLGLDGVALDTNHEGLTLDDAHFEPLLAELDRRSATLFVHPAPSPGFDATTSRLNVSVLEFMFDTTRMIAALVLSGARKRFGKVNVIAAHGGGTIPYLAGRIGLISQMPWACKDAARLTPEEVHAGLASFHFDLTASVSPTSLDALRRLVPADRLLMGFDVPFMPADTIAPAKRALADDAGFDDGAKRKIGAGNALRLFSRFTDAQIFAAPA